MLTAPRLSAARSAARPGLVALVACLALSACAYERPQSTVSPGLASGITSNNGGGVRQLGNSPNIGITTQSAPQSARQSAPARP